MKHIFSLVVLICLSLGTISAQTGTKPTGNWTLTKLSMNGSLKTYKIFSKVKLGFDETGDRISGQSTCNNYNGPCALGVAESASFDASGIMATKKFCKNGMATEGAYLQALDEADSYALKGKTLTLYKAKTVVAVFKKTE